MYFPSKLQEHPSASPRLSRVRLMMKLRVSQMLSTPSAVRIANSVLSSLKAMSLTSMSKFQSLRSLCSSKLQTATFFPSDITRQQPLLLRSISVGVNGISNDSISSNCLASRTCMPVDVASITLRASGVNRTAVGFPSFLVFNLNSSVSQAPRSYTVALFLSFSFLMTIQFIPDGLMVTSSRKFFLPSSHNGSLRQVNNEWSS